MKIVKHIRVIQLAVFLCCLSANIAFASDPLAIITINSTGKELKTEELLYYPQQQIWRFVAEGSAQEQLARANDVCVNTPAGILYAGENGKLCINPGDGYSSIELEYSEFQWNIKETDHQDDEPLAVVQLINSKKTFKCDLSMWYDVQSDLWSFNCEEGDAATRHYTSDDIIITTPAGVMAMNEDSLWMYWNDWRKYKTPMSISPNPDGSLIIQHGAMHF